MAAGRRLPAHPFHAYLASLPASPLLVEWQDELLARCSGTNLGLSQPICARLRLMLCKCVSIIEKHGRLFAGAAVEVIVLKEHIGFSSLDIELIHCCILHSCKGPSLVRLLQAAVCFKSCWNRNPNSSGNVWFPICVGRRACA
eukprot:SAG31_NODE_17080_length_684_cov_1.049573_1_plen_143_part_00